ncbi:MAG: hypothetical protein HOQ34_13085 [Gemmatimonadaceae bacterium]|nr:hypothetical protein [Gemmatimonadaceae bacterium]
MRNCCAILAAALLATACTEKLGSGRACPDLCPIEEVFISDTTIQGVVVDSTVFAGPAVGSEGRILLATRTDGAIDLRGVLRFDTLPNTFTVTKNGTTVTDTIQGVLQSQLVVSGADTSTRQIPAGDSNVIAAYDVDTVGVLDTAVSPVAALFVPSRKLGEGRFPSVLAIDTMRIPLNDSIVGARMVGNGRLRIGLRIESGGNTTVRLSSTTGSRQPVLRYRAFSGADTTSKDTLLTWYPNSGSPTDDQVVKAQLADYTLVVKGTPPPPTGVFAVGGVRGRRTYLAFDVPRRLLDSTQIVRATLHLSQVPAPLAEPGDTALLEALLGTAKGVVKDISKRTLFHEPVTFDINGRIVGAMSGLPQVAIKADTTATRSIEVAPILRQWANVDSTDVPHTIILQLPTEGIELTELWFASLEATPALRPTLQITFVPRNAPGIP